MRCTAYLQQQLLLVAPIAVYQFGNADRTVGRQSVVVAGTRCGGDVILRARRIPLDLIARKRARDGHRDSGNGIERGLDRRGAGVVCYGGALGAGVVLQLVGAAGGIAARRDNAHLERDPDSSRVAVKPALPVSHVDLDRVVVSVDQLRRWGVAACL